MTEPHVIRIDGDAVLVEERARPIPPSLNLLLEGGRDVSGRLWQPLRLAARDALTLSGARASCLLQDHRLQPWVAGYHLGSDLLVRFLYLLACADCGAVCVRDRSVDTLDGLSAGSRPPRRRDEVIGWYAGARPRQRLYT